MMIAYLRLYLRPLRPYLRCLARPGARPKGCLEARQALAKQMATNVASRSSLLVSRQRVNLGRAKKGRITHCTRTCNTILNTVEDLVSNIGVGERPQAASSRLELYHSWLEQALLQILIKICYAKRADDLPLERE